MIILLLGATVAAEVVLFPAASQSAGAGGCESGASTRGRSVAQARTRVAAKPSVAHGYLFR